MNRLLGLSGLAIILAAPASAQEESQPAVPLEQADSVLELLELVRLEAREGTRLNRERVERFRQTRDERQRMLEDVSRELAAEERRSTTLNRRYEQNETQLADLEERLQIRIGNFGELFGVVRDVAGDTYGQVQTSLVSAQYPNRLDLVSEMALAEELPSLEDLRGLQLMLLEEMAQSGQVVRFDAEITDPSGQTSAGDVIRVGAFNLVHDGKFLTHNAATGALQILPRQPAGRYLNMAEDLVEATSGTVEMAVDPTRGQLLGMLIQAPDLGERLQQGGYVGYTIIGMGAIGLLIALWRLVVLQGAGRRIRAQLKSSSASKNNALGRILAVYEEHQTGNLDALALKLDEAIMREAPILERYQGILKVFAAVAPLLGLLGTVVGMIITFQQLTLFGTGDPKLMAGGISQALITTVLGLIVAIPLVLLHSVVSSSSQALVEILEEQSAGLIARRAEGDAAAEA
ncbi:MAG: MotA/TolQ/ExbB proton channel family protein [Gammaproteobacteria bacterium]|nr:MotA/TolQ/ExbB proton channel family protein [Gammaproteobacteria bacterium]MDE0413020.1 MotA/TolQ/ExbB proton channel family protein [Gammaproteobacteria bacterium]